MNTYLKKQKSSLLQGDNSQKILIRIIILLSLVLLLNILASPIRNLFYLGSSPVSNVFLQSGKGIYTFFDNVFNATALREGKEKLESENQKLLSEIAVLKDAMKQNSDLTVALENTKNDDFEILEAKIVGINLPNDSITINKGSNDGIAENMPVISADKVVYGKVSKVYKNFSEVVLISAINNTFDVKISTLENQSELDLSLLEQKITHGVIRGSGNLSIYLDLVSTESEIKEGDVLVTSGLEGFLPRDLLVGTITTVNKSDVKPFQTAEVRPYFTLKNIENLFLITNYLQK